MAKKKREKAVAPAKKPEKRKYTKKPKETNVIFKKEDPKTEKVEKTEKAKPEPKSTDKVQCECGKPAEKNSHQCWDCAHRS